MNRGILVFDQNEQEWRAWIGQEAFHIVQGDTFELRVQDRYFKAYLEKDWEWFVTLNFEVVFTLHTHEVYKIRINKQHHMKAGAPF
ncbi:hypothetical protein SLU01_34620 [Sporosarcina luteola]|uniref:DUF5348 domain-containing protein n=1 Tax=Sporosarcina luteola TaxID=582850 RepID=A0A511ZCH7_9BACL|nr:DUF5348 domain-containing protein [Sporosarcina luteola]GEN85150.1 hypothetical protein SLU01_34620 [Sporosarcina luteola]